MSKLDKAKEQIAYLKFWLGVMVVTDISLVGWLVSNTNLRLYTEVLGPRSLFWSSLELVSLFIVILDSSLMHWRSYRYGNSFYDRSSCRRIRLCLYGFRCFTASEIIFEAAISSPHTMPTISSN